ncbi:STAS domain-containing protein [Variovorax sp. HJSM1_2]|uniref:STAS domain-containing protein n=1 Tax=Variovorax sp. HJSM1_2 TaxID=3366263 RepID=UPI003BD921D2
MAQDEQQPSGLLSKVVKFVRNPTVNWSDLDQPELDKESIYSKQMLKEMIERKRRNDFVRRREFDQLRKLRQREAQTHSDTSGRPSFFQSSLQSTTDDRAGTLKKIDEIEEQMSKQWWKSKDVGASNPVPLSSRAGLLRASAAAGGLSAASSEVTRPHSLDAERSLPMSLTDSLDAEHASHHFAATVLNTVPGASALDASAARSFKDTNFPKTDILPIESGLAAAMARGEGMHEPIVDMLAALDEALELDYDAVVAQSDAGPEFVHDPVLEEAAIHFANGDDEGAEDAILALIDQPPAGSTLADIWLTLFDFYRATGRQDGFDSAGIDFATRFSLSAPAWFSMPELNGLTGGAGDQAANATVFRWTCPAQLTASAAMALQAAAQAKAAPTLRLNWGALAAPLDSDAMNVLVGLLSDLAGRSVKLMFANSERLQNVLRAATPAGDATVPKQAWRLRMELLRIMGQQDAFDLVALEYCVTYEVSPPSWRDAQSSFEEVQAEDAFDLALLDDLPETPGVEGEPGEQDQVLPVLELEPSTAPVCMGLLSGVVTGDAGALLAPLENQVRGDGLMVISCKNLIRADFSAAGSILNWAATQQAVGRRVEFRDVHRLVATFFNVIGINENAKIILRRN